MGNRAKGPKHKLSKLHKRKNSLWLCYQKIHRVYCPALKENVYFTKLGWNHLVERKNRPTREYFRRLEVLPCARKVVELSRTCQGKHINPKDGIEYVNLIAVIAGITIKVTITRIGKGRFTFFSVRRLL